MRIGLPVVLLCLGVLFYLGMYIASFDDTGDFDPLRPSSLLPVLGRSVQAVAARVWDIGQALAYAPEVVCFAKAVEIVLRQRVLERFRRECAVRVDVTHQVEVGLRDEFSQAHNFVRFVAKGQHIELGAMIKALELCQGRTAQRLVLLERLGTFIQTDLGLGNILDRRFLRGCQDLATLRNAAAHAVSSNREDATRARTLALHSLVELSGPTDAPGSVVS